MAIIVALLTVLATAAGGLLALRARDRMHLVLGLSAGLLLGLVAFDLIPETLHMSEATLLEIPIPMIAFVAGFLALHILERASGTHEPAESEYGHDHGHGHEATGILGALAMAGHVFLDGLAIGVAFQLSPAIAVPVTIAVVAHAFSDGLNTVSLLIRSGQWQKKAIALLGVDGIARVAGAVLGSYLILSEPALAIYLAVFAGFIVYIATSHILPEAHSTHPSRLTLVATLLGVVIMFIVVANVHALE
jgi:zinc transporter, ZIP family